MDLKDSVLVISEGEKIPEWYDSGQIFLCFTACSREPDLTSCLDGDHERSGVGSTFSDNIGFALSFLYAVWYKISGFQHAS